MSNFLAAIRAALIISVAPGLAQALTAAEVANPTPETLVVSVKFVDSTTAVVVGDEREVRLRAAFNEANAILQRSGATWALSLQEWVTVSVEAENAVLVTAGAHRKLEARALADENYAWRPDAINVYFLRLLGGRGECSLPSHGNIVVFDNVSGDLTASFSSTSSATT
jgi:hypothetical protein